MSEEIKFDLDKDIIMQIEMNSYMKYNDTIASMNDHLGEIYGYSDVKNVEEAQLHYEKELAYKAIKDLQQKVEQLEKENKELKHQELCKTYDERLFSLKLRIEQSEEENFQLKMEWALVKSALDTSEKRVEQLENIRKEAIEYIGNKNLGIPRHTREKALNILNKGSDKE